MLCSIRASTVATCAASPISPPRRVKTPGRRQGSKKRAASIGDRQSSGWFYQALAGSDVTGEDIDRVDRPIIYDPVGRALAGHCDRVPDARCAVQTAKHTEHRSENVKQERTVLEAAWMGEGGDRARP